MPRAIAKTRRIHWKNQWVKHEPIIGTRLNVLDFTLSNAMTSFRRMTLDYITAFSGNPIYAMVASCLRYFNFFLSTLKCILFVVCFERVNITREIGTDSFIDTGSATQRPIEGIPFFYFWNACYRLIGIHKYILFNNIVLHSDWTLTISTHSE